MCTEYCCGGVEDEDYGGSEDIFSYLPAAEMMIMALVNMGIGDRVQDAYNSRRWYKFVSARRPSQCINVMQGAMRQDREHEQSRDIEQGDYVGLSAAHNKHMVGTQIRIIKNNICHNNNNADTLGRSGTMSSCVRKKRPVVLRCSIHVA